MNTSEGRLPIVFRVPPRYMRPRATLTTHACGPVRSGEQHVRKRCWSSCPGWQERQNAQAWARTTPANEPGLIWRRDPRLWELQPPPGLKIGITLSACQPSPGFHHNALPKTVRVRRKTRHSLRRSLFRLGRFRKWSPQRRGSVERGVVCSMRSSEFAS